MWGLLACAGAAYAGVCALLFLFQRQLLYLPGPPPAATPADVGLAFDELRLTTADGEELHAWRVHALPSPREDGAADEPRGLVLYAHGNAGSIEHRLAPARALAAMGVDVLLFDYRGYGASTGRPSEEGTYLDAEAVHDWAVTDGGYAPGRIVGFGESLGGAVVVELARRRALAGLVLESSFTSVPDRASELYPWLPVRWLARDAYASIDKLGALELPILVLHGRADEVVPFAHGERLHAAAGARSRFVELSGGHNGGGFRARAESLRAVEEHLRACLP